MITATAAETEAAGVIEIVETETEGTKYGQR
jgi:hypothetical protein